MARRGSEGIARKDRGRRERKEIKVKKAQRKKRERRRAATSGSTNQCVTIRGNQFSSVSTIFTSSVLHEAHGLQLAQERKRERKREVIFHIEIVTYEGEEKERQDKTIQIYSMFNAHSCVRVERPFFN